MSANIVTPIRIFGSYTSVTSHPKNCAKSWTHKHKPLELQYVKHQMPAVFSVQSLLRH